MSHAALKKFDQVLARYSAHAGILSAVPVDQTDPGRLEILEAEIGSKLPPAVHALLSRYDGERQGAEGLFLGHGLMSIGRIKDGVAYAQTLIKPELPYVVDLAASQAILEAIVVEVMALVDRTARSGMFAQNWNRCAFGCSPNSGDGPYIYLTTDTPDTDRIVVGYDAATLDRLTKLSGDLHQIERETFNWDDLKFAVNRDGQFVVSRDFYRLTGEDSFTSFPEGAIKRTYFHLRWVPLIHDFGGNYIGVDLDPGPTGHYGQVIVFGRDEDDMFVLAESWEAFLDLILDLIDCRSDDLLGCGHLHDFLQPIIREESDSENA